MDKEKYFACDGIEGRYQKAIAAETAKALMLCCEQEPEFEQAVEQSDKTFHQCLDKIVKGVKGSMSDLETYNKAVKFYFPTAAIHFNMTINLSGDNGYQAPPIKKTEHKSSGLSISLDSMLADL